MAIKRKSLSGALLSGLVFPGLGQMVLKRYRRGVILMFAVLGSLAVVVTETMRQALAILDQIEATGGAISTNVIADAVHQASTASDSRVIKVALVCMVLCWIISAVDAYTIGRKLDAEDNDPSSPARGSGNDPEEK
jgi:hypothetical protein